MRVLEVEEPILRVNDTLGEAPVWDTVRQKLYWVDIDGRRIHAYHPSTSVHVCRRFEYKVSAIACTDKDDGLIAAIDDGFAFIPFSTLESPSISESHSQSEKVASLEIIQTIILLPGEKRFNEGMVDPAGRFLAGTMGLVHGTYDGRMFALVKGQVGSEPIKEGITCTNGMGWVDDGRTMYFTDSWDKKIERYEYNPTTGEMSNPAPFSSDLNLSEEYGWPDGLCLDADNGVWSARWAAGKVIRLTPEGKVDIVLNFPRAWNMTSCVFGGPDTDELYITSARTDIEGESGLDKPDGGSLYVVKNLGYRGIEGYRYAR